jgi:serine/threonine-protein kinase RsbW
VADEDLDSVPQEDSSRPLGAGGLGLRIVRQLAAASGWYTDDRTKHVWAEFPMISTPEEA